MERDGKSLRRSRARRCALSLLLPITAACEPEPPRLAVTATGGDPGHAPDLIRKHGCGTCHVVPGVRGADGKVGPPLEGFARRVYIAGAVPNTPEHLIAWIQAPQVIEPGTAMPNMGVSETEARHIAAYLYTLDE